MILLSISRIAHNTHTPYHSHPSSLYIRVLVGRRKKAIMLLGGSWCQELDGGDPLQVRTYHASPYSLTSLVTLSLSLFLSLLYSHLSPPSTSNYLNPVVTCLHCPALHSFFSHSLLTRNSLHLVCSCLYPRTGGAFSTPHAVPSCPSHS